MQLTVIILVVCVLSLTVSNVLLWKVIKRSLELDLQALNVIHERFESITATKEATR